MARGHRASGSGRDLFYCAGVSLRRRNKARDRGVAERIIEYELLEQHVAPPAERLIYVAAKLELTDHIGDDGAGAQDLAQKLKVDPAALYRVMRVLAGLGVLRQDDNDQFYVTPFGETLRKDSPQSVRDYAIY